jgi:hypothetical protein
LDVHPAFFGGIRLLPEADDQKKRFGNLDLPEGIAEADGGTMVFSFD